MKDAPALHRLEYLIYRTFYGIVRALPHARTRGFGAGLGRVLSWLIPRRRKTALANLALALPETTEADRKRILRGCYRHFGSALCETISVGRFDAAELREWVTVEGWEHLESVDRKGGLLILGAHLGMWEISAQIVGHFLAPMDVIVRPLDNPLLDAELSRERQRSRNRLIPRRGAARQVLKAIKAGGTVGILIDQRVPARESITVPFFGHPALTSPILAKVSLRTGAPVVPIFCFPEPGGRYRFIAHPPIEPRDGDDDPVQELTRLYLETAEREIRNHPEMWLWFHRRWKLPETGS